MNLVTRFTGLYQSETLVDVTLAAEGKHLQVSCVAIICPIDGFSKKIVFCYQNCSDLLWEKIVLVIEKNFWNSRLKAENLQHFLDH